MLKATVNVTVTRAWQLASCQALDGRLQLQQATYHLWAMRRLCRHPVCRSRLQHQDPPTLYVSAKMSSFSILRSASFLASCSSVPSLYKRCNSRGCRDRAQLPTKDALLPSTTLARTCLQSNSRDAAKCRRL